MCESRCLKSLLQAWLGRELSPVEWGWEVKNSLLVPQKTELPPAPKVLLELVSCKCKKGCGTSCGCRKSGLPCTDICINCAEMGCTNCVDIDMDPTTAVIQEDTSRVDITDHETHEVTSDNYIADTTPVTSDVSNRLDINAYRSEEIPSDNHIPSFPVELNVSLTQLNTTPHVDSNNDSLNISGNAHLDLSITEYLRDKVHLSLQAGHSG